MPFQDGTGAKVRPCLVLRVASRQIEVLKITSQDKSHRSDHIEMETRSWDHKATHNSFVDLSSPVWITDADFVRRAGRADDRTWDIVTHEHYVGWARTA